MVQNQLVRLVAGWLKHTASPGTVPILGLSAPQGAGKTTIMREVCDALAKDGLNVASISIDDFYLTRSEQIALAREYPRNPYLQQRGYAGTHDVSLGVTILEALRTLTDGQGMKVPGYDRSAYQGLGDRLPEANWRVVTAPLHLIVLEGWMLGFTPIAEERLNDKDLLVINQALAAYRAWHTLLDGFIWLEPEDHLFVREWRVEAEERAMAEGKPGMSVERIRAFVETFLPAYATYYPALRAQPPTKPPHLRIVLGRDRGVKSVRHDWHS
jgi:D-glycerate 3-kinase